MKTILALARAIYGRLLRLYPRGFRDEFEAEMQAVFDQTAAHAARHGWATLVSLCWRELRDWPAAVLREHERERRRSVLNHSQPTPIDPPVSPLALVAVLAVFMLPVLVASPDVAVPGFSRVMLVPALLLVLLTIVSLLVGFVRGLPRWALPYAGLVLSIPVFAVTSLLIPQIAWLDALYRRLRIADTLLSRLVWQLHLPALYWLVMLGGVGLVVLACAVINPLRPFYRRLRQDWTQVSFVLYGATLLLFEIDFDDYQHEFPVVLVCMLWMAAGAWAYLRSHRSGQRLAALLLGGTLMLAAMGVGKWLLVPAQDWPQWFQWHPAATERWFEALRTIPTWICMVLALTAPVALGRLRPARSVQP